MLGTCPSHAMPCPENACHHPPQQAWYCPPPCPPTAPAGHAVMSENTNTSHRRVYEGKKGRKGGEKVGLGVVGRVVGEGKCVCPSRQAAVGQCIGRITGPRAAPGRQGVQPCWRGRQAKAGSQPHACPPGHASQTTANECKVMVK